MIIVLGWIPVPSEMSELKKEINDAIEPALQRQKELQQMFEYELKRKLSEKAKTTSGEMRLLLNGFKFFDLNYTGIIGSLERYLNMTMINLNILILQ